MLQCVFDGERPSFVSFKDPRPFSFFLIRPSEAGREGCVVPFSPDGLAQLIPAL